MSFMDNPKVGVPPKFLLEYQYIYLEECKIQKQQLKLGLSCSWENCKLNFKCSMGCIETEINDCHWVMIKATDDFLSFPAGGC